MLDDRLRARVAPLLDRAVRPLVRRGVAPDLVTGVGLGLGLAAAATAAVGGHPAIAVAFFVANRLVDGLDGAIARRTPRRQPRDGAAPPWGGVWDLTADVVVYVAVPIGLAVDRPELWPAVAALCATIAVNLVTVLGTASPSPSDRAVALAPGLVEGSETIAAYVLLLAVPAASPGGIWVFAAATGLTAADRLRRLRRMSSTSPGGPAPR